MRFISLQGYPQFFDDLNRTIRVPLSHIAFVSRCRPYPTAPRLDVVRVGRFVASYVPRIKDFARLNPRFRLDPTVWAKFPDYHDYGFAVFQLDSSAGGGAVVKPHPMAFEFPTRLQAALFFLTMPIHDGFVHPTDVFDHQFFYQGTARPDAGTFNAPVLSSKVLGSAFPAQKAKGVVDDSQCCYRAGMVGTFANQDTLHPIL